MCCSKLTSAESTLACPVEKISGHLAWERSAKSCEHSARPSTGRKPKKSYLKQKAMLQKLVRHPKGYCHCLLKKTKSTLYTNKQIYQQQMVIKLYLGNKRSLESGVCLSLFFRLTAATKHRKEQK